MLLQNTHVGNLLAQILLRLYESEGQKLVRQVSFAQGDTLYRAGDTVDRVYLIETGLTSVQTCLADGRTVEVAMIGHEGMVGFFSLWGATTISSRIIAQSPCRALAISTSMFRAAFDNDARFRTAMLRFIRHCLAMVSRTAACNQLHTTEQRCARWLLMVSDRLDAACVQITQEFLANTLGVRRAGITVVAGRLRKKGLIDYRHGTIRIVDREALKLHACECYASDHDDLTALVKGFE